MKSKIKSKATGNKQSSSHASSHSNPAAHQTHNVEHSSHANTGLKTCEETEAGGFGSFDESFGNSDHCTSTATQYCSNCNKNVCDNHYDSHHRSHDNNFNSQRQGKGLFHQ